MVIWKYQLDVRQNQLVHMPVDATILSLGVQNDYPVIWALTSGEEVKSTQRIFSVVTTGERFETPHNHGTFQGSLNSMMEGKEIQPFNFLGTVTLGKDMTSGNPSAWYVAHVFEGYVKVKDNKIADRREIEQELKS